MFRKMPFILLTVIILILLINPLLSLPAQQISYAASLTIKSIIVFLLPFIIFSLLFKTAVNLAHRATAVIGLILIAVCSSNFLSTFLSHYVGEWVYHFNLSLILPTETSHSLAPAWQWESPKLIANNKAMFGGIILGIIFGITQKKLATLVAERLELAVNLILKTFTYIIPIFVAGFVIKLQCDGVVQVILKDYAKIFLIITAAQFGYIFFIYSLLNYFNGRKTLSCIKNILPAAIAGFSTMSSAAVMPLTIVGAENNAKNKSLAGAVIPATVNIHLVGDCFAIPIFAYAIMKSFGIAEPSLMADLTFIAYFFLAKFSVAAIPGGGIIVMLPILENYLGFNAEMLSLITALYILFDPVITSANILGNGAFAKLIDKLFSYQDQLIPLVKVEEESTS